MLNLQAVETALVTALKARDQIAADTLRALKTRIQNEQITKGGPLPESDLLSLVQSEVKRRKEAAIAFRDAGRTESADKEESEIDVLIPFLPAQVGEDEINAVIDEKIAVSNWTVKDFGSAMGALKQHFGNTADGGTISKLLKEKLK
ncbi:MAG: GatB/YqeY domain-containing protein [bacterium]|nr:GatB/YqeY domain-containing protein [bacterium]